NRLLCVRRNHTNFGVGGEILQTLERGILCYQPDIRTVGSSEHLPIEAMIPTHQEWRKTQIAQLRLISNHRISDRRAAIDHLPLKVGMRKLLLQRFLLFQYN